MTTTPIEQYVTEFTNVKSTLSGQALPWLETVRKLAVRAISANGFPQRKHEEWKYTDISKLTDKFFQPVQGTAPSLLWKELDNSGLDLKDSYPILFLDGRYVSLFSGLAELPDGITIDSLQQVFTHN